MNKAAKGAKRGAKTGAVALDASRIGKKTSYIPYSEAERRYFDSIRDIARTSSRVGTKAVPGIPSLLSDPGVQRQSMRLSRAKQEYDEAARGSLLNLAEKNDRQAAARRKRLFKRELVMAEGSKVAGGSKLSVADLKAAKPLEPGVIPFSYHVRRPPPQPAQEDKYVFKARPIPSTTDNPFQLMHVHAKPTRPVAMKLHTEERQEQRDAEIERKLAQRKEMELELRRIEAHRAAREAAMLREERRKTNFVARPLPKMYLK